MDQAVPILASTQAWRRAMERRRRLPHKGARGIIESMLSEEPLVTAARLNRESLISAGCSKEEVDSMTNMEVHAALQRLMNESIYDDEDEPRFPREYDEDEFNSDSDFADPGGHSALRAATEDNPREYPCPNCGTPDVLTRIDRLKGYQCDACADRAERGCD